MLFKPENKALLRKAIATLGWQMEENATGYGILTPAGRIVTVNMQTGQATGDPNSVNSLRLIYSRTVVQQAKEWAKQKGWAAEVKGDNKLTLTKRL